MGEAGRAGLGRADDSSKAEQPGVRLLGGLCGESIMAIRFEVGASCAEHCASLRDQAWGLMQARTAIENFNPTPPNPIVPLNASHASQNTPPHPTHPPALRVDMFL